jgi:hypothetical protein
MSHSKPLGEWTHLVSRLDAAGYPDRWSAQTHLHALTTVEQLRDWTQPGNPRRADEVLGALVGIAAAEGSDDPEAVLVVLHLLLPGTERIASRMRHLNHDALALVLGELTIQIRRFPIRRRTRAHAANLLMDTQHAVWLGELKPYRTDLPHRSAELLVDPIDDARTAAAEFGRPGLLNGAATYVNTDGDLDLVDMLLWARRTGAVDATDLAVLVELEYAREIPGVTSVQHHVAAAHGWSVRSVQRYRDRALAALRECSDVYLSAA